MRTITSLSPTNSSLQIGLTEELSMRVRVGRNLTSFPLPGLMTKADRVNL